MKRKQLLICTATVAALTGIFFTLRNEAPTANAGILPEKVPAFAQEVEPEPLIVAKPVAAADLQNHPEAQPQLTADASQSVKQPQPAAELNQLPQTEQESLMLAFSQARRMIHPLTDHQRTMPENAEADFLASHPGQHIRVRFLNDRLRVLSSFPNRDWQLELGLENADYGAPTLSDTRLEFDRGDIVEWYHNRPEGLEHGFVVKRKSAEFTNPADGTLRLALRAEGLTAEPLREREPGSSDLQLVNDAGQPILSYEKLKVWDADGKILAATMQPTRAGLDILVTDTTARYPITIDPIVISQEAKLEPLVTGGEADFNDHFGDSVALEGDVALIGNPLDDDNGSKSGCIYLFENISGTWIIQQKLFPLDPAANQYFGKTISLDGDKFIVGVSRDADNGDNSGSAYVFALDGSDWIQAQKLLPVDGVTEDFFGVSVALDGDTALIGAHRDDDLGLNSGSAYVFSFDGASWLQTQKLVAPDGGAEDTFGWDVELSISTNTLMIAAGDDDNGAESGSVYVYDYDVSSWSFSQKVTPPNPVAWQGFGGSIRLNGTTALIGAPGDYSFNVMGSAYVYIFDGSSWVLQAHIEPNALTENDFFGISVDLEDDMAVIGCPSIDESGVPNGGSVFIYTRTGNVWSLEQELSVPSHFDGRFGAPVAINNGTIMIGANDHFPYINWEYFYNGCTYVYTKTDTLWELQQKLTAGDNAAEDYFGDSVALDGDTALVSALHDDDNGLDSGSVYVFERTNDLWQFQQKLIASDGMPRNLFGFVSLSSDTALIGAPQANLDGGSDTGKAYIFTRSDGVWTEQQILLPDSQARGFGIGLSIEGDTAAVGAIYDNMKVPETEFSYFYGGAVYLYTRTNGVWTLQQKIVPEDGANGDQFGNSVSLSGETCLVGAYYDNAGDDQYVGSAYVYVRYQGMWSLQQKLTASDGAAYDYFGCSVSLDGNTALIGAHGAGDGYSSPGCAYIFKRIGDNWSESQKILPSGTSDSGFGISVSLNNNSALIGAYADDLGHLDDWGYGSAYLFTENNGVWDEVNKITAGNSKPYDYFGVSVSLDADTLLIGADGVDGFGLWGEPAAEQGAVYVFRIKPDSDGDGLPDSVETNTGIFVDANDTGTDPNNQDSDGDGLLDGDEVNTYGSNPLVVDSDGDYLDDGDEVQLYGTDPANPDSDNDGASDSLEVAAGTDPLVAASLPDHLHALKLMNPEITDPETAKPDGFSSSMALDGNTLAIGTGRSVYIFEKIAEDWVYITKLDPPSWFRGDFGYSIDIKGDYLLIGAPSFFGDDSRAFLYAKYDRNWELIEIIRPYFDDHDSYLQAPCFGWSVALGEDYSGDTIAVIAAFEAKDEFFDDVRVTWGYVYDVDWGGAWNMWKIKYLDNNEVSGFNYRGEGGVAIDDEYILIGDRRNCIVHVFDNYGRPFFPLSNKIAELYDIGGGRQIEVDGTRAVISGYSEIWAVVSGYSEIYYYNDYRQGGYADITLRLPTSLYSFYTHSLSFYDNKLLVGRPQPIYREQPKEQPNTDAAYLFELTDGNWKLLAKYKQPNPALGDRFGSAVALDGDQAFVSLPSFLFMRLESGEVISGNPGAVYIYDLVKDKDQGSAAWQLANGFHPQLPNDERERDTDADGEPDILEIFQGTDRSGGGKLHGIRMAAGVSSGAAFSALYRKSTEQTEVAAEGLWSVDMQNWHASGETVGGVTVELTEATESSADGYEIIRVDATVTSGTPDKLFYTLGLSPNE